MFIVMLHYLVDLPEVDKVLLEHRAHLDKGYKNNYFIASGPQCPRTGGVLLSQLKDRQILEAFMQQDPFCLKKIADYHIIEFEPVKYHEDFGSFI